MTIKRSACRAFFRIYILGLIPVLSFAHPAVIKGTDNNAMDKIIQRTTDTATFAAGCFWCVDAQFKELKGVLKVTSGFTGGQVPHPTYRQVCTGTTGHAEACNIIYDPKLITYKELLAAFFVAHDPTSLNRQGDDVGTQYRSAIFYHNTEQKNEAAYYIRRLNEEKVYDKAIVTELAPYGAFYKAEGYHQDYYANNQNVPYCQLVVKPKLDKFRKVFKDKLKKP